MQNELVADSTKLSVKEVLNLYSATKGCCEINSLVEFRTYVRTTIREVFPHEMALCYIGRIPRRLVKLVNIDYPSDFLDCVIRRNGDVCDPILAWLDRQTPIFVNVDSADERVDPIWVRVAREHKISTAVSHGVMDVGGKFFSFFCFGGIHPSVQAKYEEYVSLLVPHLHAALVRQLHPTFTAGNRVDANDSGIAPLDTYETHTQSNLTHREKQIFAWVCVGKTNWEISKILNISENTVKNHVQNIHRKLGVSNRTHAAALGKTRPALLSRTGRTSESQKMQTADTRRR
jgi:transcriptional regulator EpsA